MQERNLIQETYQEKTAKTAMKNRNDRLFAGFGFKTDGKQLEQKQQEQIKKQNVKTRNTSPDMKKIINPLNIRAC